MIFDLQGAGLKQDWNILNQIVSRFVTVYEEPQPALLLSAVSTIVATKRTTSNHK